MKNGKKPTLAQKKFLQDTGLDSEKWLIVKDTPEEMVIVSRIALQRRSGKTKTIRRRRNERESDVKVPEEIRKGGKRQGCVPT